MATKAELEAAFLRYAGRSEAARTLAAAHDYPAAVRAAAEALPSTWDAVAYQRRYRRDERPALPAIDLLLRYAPAVFDGPALDALESWWVGAKRAGKKRYPDLPADLAASRRAMRLAARLWDDLDEPSPPAPADPWAAAIVGAWVAMGAASPGPGGGAVRHVSHPRAPTEAVCPNCGGLRRAGLSDLLDPVTCGRCGRASVFVLARRVA